MRKYNLKIEKVKVHISKILSFSITNYPTKVDLRSKCPPIYDQGLLGSCTANAGCAAFRFDDSKSDPSRLFLYYNERMLDGTIPSDNGSSLSQCVNALETYGVCSESSWPYDITKFTDKPTKECYDEASKHIVIQAKQISQTMNDMKACLASGLPFILGILVYASFESPVVENTGIVSIPAKNEPLLGGHAVMCVGYDDSKKWWICQNSWSDQWGDHGYFYLPYDYLTSKNLASDMWVIQKVSKT